MLNVPESVKALFKQDGIRKNFRVHFPGGELPDITNDSVVQESVRFTESLCSQDVLKFGLTEASVLEFETVGVANMYGMTIEAGIEIDLSSLSASELAEIEAGSWDGVYVSESDTDLGFPFFRVPYGVFRVESCPRDHQTMAHRRVTATSLQSIRHNPFEALKLSLEYSESYYTPNVYLLAMASLCYSNKSFLINEGFIESDILYNQTTGDSGSSASLYKITNVKTASGLSRAITVRIFYDTGYTNRGDQQVSFALDKNSLYSIDLNGYDYRSLTGWVANFIETSDYNVDLDQSGFESWESLAIALFPDFNGQPLIFPSIRYLSTFYDSSSNEQRRVSSYLPFSENNMAIYPTIGNAQFINAQQLYKTHANFYIPAIIKISSTAGDDSAEFNLRNDGVYPTIKRLIRPNLPVSTIFIENTAAIEKNIDNIVFTAYSFIDSYSQLDFLNGYLELLAAFGKTSRNGTMQVLRLDDSDPEAVQPAYYDSFWWDEYDVDTIGTITYKYRETKDNAESILNYTIGSGKSKYDITGNAVLEALESRGQYGITSLLQESFVPFIDPITFTPIDLSMKGLPYLEAGDYLAVTAEDGTIANSFAMRQTISGIQVLTAEIESTSGDIIESEEGET